MVYTTVFPPTGGETGSPGDYVAATSVYHAGFFPYFATQEGGTIRGDWGENGWASGDVNITNQRFHIDLGAQYVIKRVYYVNDHSSGDYTGAGVKEFTLYGSNDTSAFAQLDYSIDTGWIGPITNDATNGEFVIHPNDDTQDYKQYILLTNSTAYQYYCFKFANNYWVDSQPLLGMGFRRLELQGQAISTGGFKVNGVAYENIGSVDGVYLAALSKVNGVSKTI